MTAAARRLVAFLKAEDGPTAVEYAVVLALVVVVCVAVLLTMGENSGNAFNQTGATMEASAGE